QPARRRIVRPLAGARPQHTGAGTDLSLLSLAWPHRGRGDRRRRAQQGAEHRRHPARGRAYRRSRAAAGRRCLEADARPTPARSLSAAALSLFHGGEPLRPVADLEDRAGGRAGRAQQRRGIPARRLFPVLRHHAHPGLHRELRRGGAGDRGRGLAPARAAADAVARMNALEVAVTRKAYRSERGETAALADVAFAVPAGQLACLIGPSGSGKTTLLSLIAGLDRSFEGKIQLGGAAGGRLGMVFQTPRLMPWLSARDNVRLALDHTSDSTARAERMLE